MASKRQSKKATRTKRKRDQGPKLDDAEGNGAAMEFGVLVDMRLLKTFPYKRKVREKMRKTNEYFIGTIINFQPALEGHPPKKRNKINRPPLGPGLYRVLFDDGDVEDMDPDEALECIMTYQYQRMHKMDPNKKCNSEFQSKLIVGRTPNKKKKNFEEVNEILGLESIVSYSNPPLTEKEFNILDQERRDYWFAYEEYNLENNLPKPTKLNVNEISSLWVPLNDAIASVTTTNHSIDQAIPDAPILISDASEPTILETKSTDSMKKPSREPIEDDIISSTKNDASSSKACASCDELDMDSESNASKPIILEAKSTDFMKKSLTKPIEDDIISSTENDASGSKARASCDELDMDSLPKVEGEKGSNRENENKSDTASKENQMGDLQNSRTPPDESEEEKLRKNKNDKDSIQRTNSPDQMQAQQKDSNDEADRSPSPDILEIDSSDVTNQEEKDESKTVGPVELTLKSIQAYIPRLKRSKKADTVTKRKRDQLRKLPTRKEVKGNSEAQKQNSVQKNVDCKGMEASNKNQNNNRVATKVQAVTSEEKSKDDALEATSSEQACIYTIQKEYDHVAKELKRDTNKMLPTAEQQKKTSYVTPKSNDGTDSNAHTGKEEMSTETTRQVSNGSPEVKAVESDGHASNKSGHFVEGGCAHQNLGTEDGLDFTKQHEQIESLPPLTQKTTSVNQGTIIMPTTRQLKNVVIGHPRPDVIEGKRLYSRRELFALGAHRSDHQIINGNSVDGADSILLHRQAESALRRKDDLVMFKFARTLKNGGEHLYINFKKNLPIRVFRRSKKASPIKYRYEGVYSIIAIFDDDGCPRIELPTSEFVRLEFLLKRCSGSGKNSSTDDQNSLTVDQLWEEVNRPQEEISRQEDTKIPCSQVGPAKKSINGPCRDGNSPTVQGYKSSLAPDLSSKNGSENPKNVTQGNTESTAIAGVSVPNQSRRQKSADETEEK